MLLAKLAALVGLKKTSAWRLVRTLVQLGYIRQDPVTKPFRPAPRVLALGYSYLEGLDLKQVAAPFLRELSARVQETVNMSVLDGHELIYIDRVGTAQIINVNLHVGSHLPLYNTSLGRALICEAAKTWGPSQYPLYTDVPADAALERRAVNAVDSRDDWERAEGAAALCLFPSGENAELLKKLLSDTALSAPGSERPRSYIVRTVAYQSLMRMGVRVPQPILEK
jgi:hypothetical protein